MFPLVKAATRIPKVRMLQHMKHTCLNVFLSAETGSVKLRVAEMSEYAFVVMHHGVIYIRTAQVKSGRPNIFDVRHRLFDKICEDHLNNLIFDFPYVVTYVEPACFIRVDLLL